jgi:hypothetical protein
MKALVFCAMRKLVNFTQSRGQLGIAQGWRWPGRRALSWGGGHFPRENSDVINFCDIHYWKKKLV